MLHLLQIFLKGDVQAWSKSFEEALHRADPSVQLSWDNLKDGLEVEFVKVEDLDKVWQDVQEVRQMEGEVVNDYIKKFSYLWEDLSMALQPQVPPLDMMKKISFLVGLRDNLHWKVELKKRRSYEESLEIAKRKVSKLEQLS